MHTYGWNKQKHGIIELTEYIISQQPAGLNSLHI